VDGKIVREEVQIEKAVGGWVPGDILLVIYFRTVLGVAHSARQIVLFFAGCIM
jgi:hypothetical protein